MTQDQVIAAAKAARSIWGESAILPFEELERFYAIAYRKGLEDAALEFDRRAVLPDGTISDGWYEPDEPAQIIRAHAKNQPESTHDTGNV